MKITLFLSPSWWHSHALWLILLVRHPATSTLCGSQIEKWSESNTRVMERLWWQCEGLEQRLGLPQRHNEERKKKKKRHLYHQKCVYVCVCGIVWERKSKIPQHKEPVCAAGSKLSITLDSQGLFRTALNRSPTLPAGGLEAQDAPTTELHPASLQRRAYFCHEGPQQPPRRRILFVTGAQIT